jgi:hypothetical protein
MKIPRYRVSNGLVTRTEDFNLRNVDVVLASDYDALAAEFQSYRLATVSIESDHKSRISTLEAALQKLYYQAFREPFTNGKSALMVEAMYEAALLIQPFTAETGAKNA